MFKIKQTHRVSPRPISKL